MFRVQPVWVKVVKKVFGRCRSSSAMSPARPVASATTIWVIQSGMRRAARDVDHRQARPSSEVRAEEAALLALVELQAGASRVGLGAVAGMPPQRRAVADRDDDTAPRPTRSRHPVLHRAAGEAVPVAGAVRRLHHRALEDEDVERRSRRRRSRAAASAHCRPAPGRATDATAG